MERGLWGFPNPSGNPSYFSLAFSKLSTRSSGFASQVPGAQRLRPQNAINISSNTDMARNKLSQRLAGERPRGDETPQRTMVCTVA